MPREHRRERPAAVVEGDQAVPEARRPDGVDALVAAVDHSADERDHLVRVVAVVPVAPQLVERLASLVEALRPHR